MMPIKQTNNKRKDVATEWVNGLSEKEQEYAFQELYGTLVLGKPSVARKKETNSAYSDALILKNVPTAARSAPFTNLKGSFSTKNLNATESRILSNPGPTTSSTSLTTEENVAQYESKLVEDEEQGGGDKDLELSLQDLNPAKTENSPQSCKEYGCFDQNEICSTFVRGGNSDCELVKSGETYINTDLCQTCLKLFCKMVKLNGHAQPNKKYDTDPVSLSCDEWILKKPHFVPGPPRQRIDLASIVRRLRQQALLSAQARSRTKHEQCKRSHPFLQRSLTPGPVKANPSGADELLTVDEECTQNHGA
nr:PREDICTED: uncharacterized protein LOC102358689 isoform X2 [Latimeria chalumnae]|eukprot:XP_014345768.1 PREDICTED: uncharacterized protein LOC102358689 isoform X2 [Latimeria chalumnae]